MDSRHLARLLAVQYFFTKEKSKRSNAKYIVFEPNTLLSILEEKKFNTKLYESIVDGVEKDEKKIDKIIQDKAPQWPIDKINPVDLIILRIAIWEGLIFKQTPLKVVINEAIELDKVLSSKDSSSFINGVLGNLLIQENE